MTEKTVKQETSDKQKPSSMSYNERLGNILEINLGKNLKTLEALQELSTFLDENTLNSRRTLRSKVEERGINIIKEFLKFVEPVITSLDYIHNSAVSMKRIVDDTIENLDVAESKTSELREQVNKLQEKRQLISLEQTLIAKYLERFQLAPREVDILKQPEITDEFFIILEKIQKIHSNCQFLLQSGHQILALSIIEQISALQETAIEFLYRWVQVHCKDIESPKTAFLLAKSMKQFQNRMILFGNLMEEYSTARRSVVVRSFIDALTKNGPGGVSKPIESYAQDKKRYVGDMLAWLHQFIPIEKENCLLLLKECNIHNPEVRDEMNKCLSNITEGVCSSLSVRIECIISSSPTPFELYDTYSLLRYYSNVIGEELPNSSLAKTLQELHGLTECAFLNAIQNFVRQSLLERIEAPAPNLKPSSGVSHLLNFMTEILSLVGLAEGQKEFVIQVVNCVIEPLMQAINLSASRLTSVDMAVYLLNCLNEILNMLSMYAFVDDWLERLEAQVDAQIDTLTSEQASSLVLNLNLSSIYTILQSTSKIPLSQVPGMDPNSLQIFMTKLESFLTTPDIMILPQINYIMNSTHSRKVCQRANEVIVAVYKQLYKCVHDAANMYANPSTLMPRTPEEIETLLLASEINSINLLGNPVQI